MYGIVLRIKEELDGLKKEDVIDLMDHLEGDEGYPVEFHAEKFEYTAMGFISKEASEKLDHDYTGLAAYIKDLMDNPMSNFFSGYEYNEIQIYICRQYKRIRLHDFYDYDFEKSHNGGCYSYHTQYERLPDGKYKISYATSSDFKYCSINGSFCNESDCESCDWHRQGHEIITEEDMMKELIKFGANVLSWPDKYEIECEYE